MLCSGQEEAKLLLHCYDVYIFLEANPDGNLLGNSTRNAAGSDLLEVQTCSRVLHPELFYAQKALKEIDNASKIELLFLFQDSYRRRGHFITTEEQQTKSKKIIEIPVLLNEFCSNFKLQNCQFVQRSELCFAMQSMLQNMCLTQVYGFHVDAIENGHQHYFTYDDYNQLGKNFVYSLMIYCVNKKGFA